MNRKWKRNARDASGNKGTYYTWRDMGRRCDTPKNKEFKNYGGRGITVCTRWLSFDNFLDDMGYRPPGLSLDRINNDGNYAPENCRWATRKQQIENSRKARLVTHQGHTLTLAAWAKKIGITPSGLSCRLRAGWSHEKALTTPVRT